MPDTPVLVGTPTELLPVAADPTADHKIVELSNGNIAVMYRSSSADPAVNGLYVQVVGPTGRTIGVPERVVTNGPLQVFDLVATDDGLAISYTKLGPSSETRVAHWTIDGADFSQDWDVALDAPDDVAEIDMGVARDGSYRVALSSDRNEDNDVTLFSVSSEGDVTPGRNINNTTDDKDDAIALAIEADTTLVAFAREREAGTSLLIQVRVIDEANNTERSQNVASLSIDGLGGEQLDGLEMATFSDGRVLLAWSTRQSNPTGPDALSYAIHFTIYNQDLTESTGIITIPGDPDFGPFTDLTIATLSDHNHIIGWDRSEGPPQFQRYDGVETSGDQFGIAADNFSVSMIGLNAGLPSGSFAVTGIGGNLDDGFQPEVSLFETNPNLITLLLDGRRVLTSMDDVFADSTLTSGEILGWAGDDFLIGNVGADTLDGGEGNDTLSGQEGDDRLLGGAGDDELVGGVGSDRLFGEDGADRMNGGASTDTISGGAGNDTLIGGPDDSSDLRDVIFGGDGDDSIVGGHGNDSLRGDAGDDTIAGGFGVDTVIGAAGDDVITGSAFSDLMFGGAGNDFINGGFGSDRVNGGDGADRFYHIGVEGHGSDWIQDFGPDDVLLYGGTATAEQFQVNFARTLNAGGIAADEAFVIYKPTGQILWALVDGGAQLSINLRIAGEEFDLLA
ncbi:MAG: calcium-binding protein [Pseudomonadota bacterium]